MTKGSELVLNGEEYVGELEDFALEVSGQVFAQALHKDMQQFRREKVQFELCGCPKCLHSIEARRATLQKKWTMPR